MEPERCSHCQTTLPTGAPEGMCPVCAFGGALRSPMDAQAGSPAEPMPPPSNPAAGGTRVRYFGDYELLGEIARGGMGVVYKARQLSLNRTVALKMIQGAVASDPGFVKRFQLEASAAARLQHPNIVAIHEIGEHEGQQYFSMDYVAGLNLQQVQANTPLNPHRAARYMVSIAEAIAYAHGEGLLHRDLKPSNVLVDVFDEPRVTDFGLARELQVDSGLTVTGQVMGTPNYMPPEQAGGRQEQVTVTSDVYGLGAILYFLLTGRPPFQGETLAEVLRQVTEVDPVPLRLLNPSIPRDLETICLKCLEKEPHRRYGTAGEFADELRRFVRDEPIQARPANTLEKAWRWCRRKPLVTGLAAGMLVVLVLGFAGVLWQWREADAARSIAEGARHDAIEKLWASYLAQARANRWSGRPGRRFDSLEVLAKAAAIRPSLLLRNEAIACLALPDVRVDQQWKLPPGGGIAFAPDLERYAWADREGVIRIYHTSDGSELLRLEGAKQPKGRFVFSPDGQYLAGRCEQPGQVFFQVWDLVSKEVVWSLPIQIHGWAVAFSPDSETVVAVDRSGQAHRFDLAVRRQLDGFSTMKEAGSLSFGPRGKRLAISSDRNRLVDIVSIGSGNVLERFDHPAGVQGVAWSSDGRVLAAACNDHLVYLWDVVTQDQKAVLAGHTAQATGVVFNRKGDMLASYGWDGRTWFWDPVTGEGLLSIPGALVPPFNANDKAMGFFVFFQDAGIWQVSPARECQRLGWAGPLYGGWYRGEFSPDGRLLAVASSDGVRLWDVKTGQRLGHLPLGMTYAAVFEVEGTSLLVCSREHGLQRWPLQTGPLPLEWRLGPPDQLILPGLGELCVSSDGHWLAAATRDGPWLIDLKGREGTKILNGHYLNTFVSFSPDGRWLATGTWKGKGVQIWEVQTGKPIRQLPVLGSAYVRFSPDGRWLVTGAPDAYRFWQVDTWEPGLVLHRDRAGDFVGELTFSPDGTLMALVHGRHRGVKLIEVATGTELASLDTCAPLDFSQDGSRLATIGADRKRLLLWDLRLIRQQLVRMNLDWDLPPLYRTPESSQATPMQLTVYSEQIPANTRFPAPLPGTAASILLGHTNLEQGLHLCSNENGLTEPAEIGGRACRRALRQTEKWNYVYFAINDAFKADLPRDVVLEVEYFDAGQGSFGIHYDTSPSAGPRQGAYTPSPRTEKLTNTRQWKRTCFVLPGATFRNGQNAGADLRLDIRESRFFIRSVSLSGLAARRLD